mmetsp:Transcript_11981/g.34678  ORF Transcript_11981/g.34678 Transcript_11981/m.34678 type:complete len:255 (-) Transcript_11981:98-862(-)
MAISAHPCVVNREVCAGERGWCASSPSPRLSSGATSPERRIRFSRSTAPTRHSRACRTCSSSLESRSSVRCTWRSGRGRWPRRRCTLTSEPRRSPRTATRWLVVALHAPPSARSASSTDPPSTAVTSKALAPAVRRARTARCSANERSLQAALYSARLIGVAATASASITPPRTAAERVARTVAPKVLRLEKRSGKWSAASSAADRLRAAASDCVGARRPPSTQSRKCGMAARAASSVVHLFIFPVPRKPGAPG